MDKSFRQVEREFGGSRSADDIIIAFPFLMMLLLRFAAYQAWCNEENTVRADRLISFASKNWQPLSRGGDQLVYATGEVTPGKFFDVETGMQTDAMRMVRTVQMYQWEELEDGFDSSRPQGQKILHSFKLAWKPDTYANTKLHSAVYGNPYAAVRSGDFSSRACRLQGREIPPDLVAKLPANVSMTIDEKAAQTLQKRLNRPCAVINNEIFVGKNPAKPELGDLRISYSKVPSGMASVVACDDGMSFVPYSVPGSGDVFLIALGKVDAAAMMKDWQIEADVQTWKTRRLWFCLASVAIAIIGACMRALTDQIPFVCSGPIWLWFLKAALLAAGGIAVMHVVAVVR